MLPTSLFNKRILFFDTETSGLDPNKNVILQLSYIVVDGTTWNILKKVNFYFAYPDEEWRITPGAIEVNHLTREFLMFQKNSNRKEALMSFLGDLHACQLAVAHNAMFDFAFIEACAIEEKILRYAWPTICCTMSETIGICKIPFFKGSKSYKYPKLEELAVFLKVKYNKNKLHDSFSDVQLVFKCFKLLHFQKMLPLYIYENNEELATHIVNADILFPHQDTSDYIGDSLSNLIIRDEWLATYSFRRKSVTCFMSEKEVKETHVRAILQEMGGWYTPSFISDDFIISNAVIISRSMDSDKRCALQQVADFQKSNPDFPVFTIEAFRRRPEADEYEKEMRRRVIKAKETRLQRLELIKEMQKNYKIDERDRTGENDMVIDGKYYRNGKLFESCTRSGVVTRQQLAELEPVFQSHNLRKNNERVLLLEMLLQNDRPYILKESKLRKHSLRLLLCYLNEHSIDNFTDLEERRLYINSVIDEEIVEKVELDSNYYVMFKIYDVDNLYTYSDLIQVK